MLQCASENELHFQRLFPNQAGLSLWQMKVGCSLTAHPPRCWLREHEVGSMKLLFHRSEPEALPGQVLSLLLQESSGSGWPEHVGGQPESPVLRERCKRCCWRPQGLASITISGFHQSWTHLL